MKTVEQIEEHLRVVEQQRKSAEDHGPAEMALVRTGQELSLLWVLGREDEIAARLGVTEDDKQLWRERGISPDQIDF
jgi:hypothetical protein